MPSWLLSFLTIQTMKKNFGEVDASVTDVGFTAKHRATCFCNVVESEVGPATIIFFLAFGFFLAACFVSLYRLF